MKWKLVYDERDDGHRIFQCAETGRYAIADRSGSFPEDTDDGVLWVRELDWNLVAKVDGHPAARVWLGYSVWMWLKNQGVPLSAFLIERALRSNDGLTLADLKLDPPSPTTLSR